MLKPKQTNAMGNASEDSQGSEINGQKRRITLGAESPTETPAETGQDKADKAPTAIKAKGKTGIRPEIADLVNELRDAAKRLDPKRHTASSLRRALGVVSDILDEIEELDDEPQGAKGKTA